MWDKESIEMYTQYLTAQEQAVLEAIDDGINSLDQVKSFVAAKLNDAVDSEYITAVWSQKMEAPYVRL
jgi:prephenate dehydrogenase